MMRITSGVEEALPSARFRWSEIAAVDGDGSREPVGRVTSARVARHGSGLSTFHLPESSCLRKWQRGTPTSRNSIRLRILEDLWAMICSAMAAALLRGGAMSQRNLILIHRGPNYEEDFGEIAQKVIARDRGITVYHLPAGLEADLPVSAWQYPTLTVSLSSKFRIPIRRGPTLSNRAIGKLDQQDTFRRNGIPTPPALPYLLGMKLDPILFGEFVVLKPIDLRMTSKGIGVKLFRRRTLENMTGQQFASAMPPGEYMVQRYVDTGAQFKWFRVCTFLGSPLYSFFAISRIVRPPLTASDEALFEAVIASNFMTDQHIQMYAPPPVIDMARKVHRAFPHIPLLGQDILIEERTERLFVLECNAGGNTWHFSSEVAREWREAHGRQVPEPNHLGAERRGRFFLIDQFGAFDVAAFALARAVRELAS